MESIFGQAYWDYYVHGLSSKPVEVKTIGGSEQRIYPRQDFKSPVEWDEELRDILSVLDGEIIEIGCGSGQYSLYLSNQGKKATPVSKSEESVYLCQERGLEGEHVESYKELPFPPDYFDSAVAIGRLMQKFSKDDFNDLLDELDRVTKNGGKAVVRLPSVGPSSSTTVKIEYGENIEHEKLYTVSLSEFNELLEGTPWNIRDKKQINGYYYFVLDKKSDVLDKS